MKILIDSNFGEIDPEIMDALQKLAKDQSKRRSYFHPLKGYHSLCALAIPGTGFQGRIILKHHGNNEYELVHIDDGHQYNSAKLMQFVDLPKRDTLKELFPAGSQEVSPEESEIPAYSLRGKIIIPTNEQWNLSESVMSFLNSESSTRKPHILVEGVPGSGKTLSIEITIENFIRKGAENDRTALFYVVPAGTNLLAKMKSHIQNLPNGQSLLDRGIIQLFHYNEFQTYLTQVPAKPVRYIMLLDEVQAATQEQLSTTFSAGQVIGFGDMNQSIQQGEHFFDIAGELGVEYTKVTLTESLRCPAEITEFAKLFLSARNKQAKEEGTKQRSYIVPLTREASQNGKHVKFYGQGFIESQNKHSTKTAYVTFSQEEKDALIKQGKINVFDASEIAGLEFDNVVICLNSRASKKILSEIVGYNLMYMLSTRSLKNLYIDSSLHKEIGFIREKYPAIELSTGIESLEESSISELKDQAKKYLIDGRYSQVSQIVNLIKKNNGLLPNDQNFNFRSAYDEAIEQNEFNIKANLVNEYAAIRTIELATGKGQYYASAYAAQMISGKGDKFATKHASKYEDLRNKGMSHNDADKTALQEAEGKNQAPVPNFATKIITERQKIPGHQNSRSPVPKGDELIDLKSYSEQITNKIFEIFQQCQSTAKKKKAFNHVQFQTKVSELLLLTNEDIGRFILTLGRHNNKEELKLAFEDVRRQIVELSTFLKVAVEKGQNVHRSYSETAKLFRFINILPIFVSNDFYNKFISTPLATILAGQLYSLFTSKTGDDTLYADPATLSHETNINNLLNVFQNGENKEKFMEYIFSEPQPQSTMSFVFNRMLLNIMTATAIIWSAAHHFIHYYKSKNIILNDKVQIILDSLEKSIQKVGDLAANNHSGSDVSDSKESYSKHASNFRSKIIQEMETKRAATTHRK